MTKTFSSVCLFLLASLLVPSFASAGTIDVEHNQLYVDGVAQPQLYGAELQYFRLRGGTGRNMPREKVIASWNRALDRMVEAKMNAISFYIPWDFHEYADGRFDFTGTADEDGDGNPDYPARDLVTFFRLVQEHGIRHIMVRPGPYINAEWGFLGFGAVPEWFHRKFPQSHMMTSTGEYTKHYDYANPAFREYSQRWLQELYRQVLVRFIGPGRPIDFIQLDNETNYMWQSLYTHDYSPSVQEQYRDFLRSRYGSLTQVNVTHRRNWASWAQIHAPTKAGLNIGEDDDWYRFHDVTIHSYLNFVRQIWEGMGVREPQVLFTLAESYNAAPDGLLPNYQLRNDPGVTGLMTVNLYPKTSEGTSHPLFNQPFKADHDVKATGAANEKYFGKPEEWALGPEIQGGWWLGTSVTPEARQQTYLSTIGHGLKAMFIYYFNEGENFGENWGTEHVQPFFKSLLAQPNYSGVPDGHLPETFWDQLQDQVDHAVLFGIDVYDLMVNTHVSRRQLHFDAPLDADGNPQLNYALVKELGEKYIAPYQGFLGQAVEMSDPVCLIKDVNEHVPSAVTGINSILLNTDWSGGLLGYLLQAGVNPRILHWGISSQSEFKKCSLLIVQDNGQASPQLARYLGQLARQGATVVSFLNDSIAAKAGFVAAKSVISSGSYLTLAGTGGSSFATSGLQFATYDLHSSPQAVPFLLNENGQVVGYVWPQGSGNFVQISALFYDVFNTDAYSTISDVPARRTVIEKLLQITKIRPVVKIVEGGDRVVAFGRKAQQGHSYLITTKSGRTDQSVQFHIAINQVNSRKKYRITDILGGTQSEINGIDLVNNGFAVELPANGSLVFFVQEM